MAECFWSCDWIEGGLAFNRRSLNVCLIAHHNGKGFPAICDYRGGEIPLAAVLSKRREIREANQENCGICPTVRASIMIATVLKAYSAKPEHSDEHFVQLCHDVLGSSRWDGQANGSLKTNIEALIKKFAA